MRARRQVGKIWESDSVRMRMGRGRTRRVLSFPLLLAHVLVQRLAQLHQLPPRPALDAVPPAAAEDHRFRAWRWQLVRVLPPCSPP